MNKYSLRSKSVKGILITVSGKGVSLENMESYFPAQNCLITKYGYIGNSISACSSLFILVLYTLQ